MQQEESEDLYLSDVDEVMPINEMMRKMATEGGSDIFISVGSPARLKIDGQHYMLTPKVLMRDDIDVMLAENLSSSQLDQLDKTKELNCALSLPGVGRFRMSAFQQRSTNAFVLRYIPPEIPVFDRLGMPVIMKELIMLKRGLVIVSGPTGSGKSTTLASLIQHRNLTKQGHIITIEDPIEFLFRHKRSIINQREIGTDALSYEEALKNAMRQAPDVILIGEIRDQKTMSMAMQYAQSGHLCLATLHANNSYNAMNRIVGFYPPEQRSALYSDLSTSLRSIVSQRLIPGIEGSRVAAVEVLINNRGIADLIENGKISEIPERMEKNNSDGSVTFESVLVEMVRERRITVEDALIYSDSPTNLFWKLSQEGISMDETAAIEAGVDRDQIADVKATSTGQSSGGMFSSISINPEA